MSELPYIETTEECVVYKQNPAYDPHKECTCGHSYEHHFSGDDKCDCICGCEKFIESKLLLNSTITVDQFVRENGHHTIIAYINELQDRLESDRTDNNTLNLNYSDLSREQGMKKFLSAVDEVFTDWETRPYNADHHSSFVDDYKAFIKRLKHSHSNIKRKEMNRGW